MSEYRIRQARADDAEDMARIWVSGQELMGIPVKQADYAAVFRDKVDHQDDIFQVWCAEFPDGRVIGWQSISPYINHPYLKPYFGESSTYVCASTRARGLGRALLVYALEHAAQTPIRYVTANVLANNDRIMKICDELGFVRVGFFPPPIKEAVIPELLFIVYPVPQAGMAVGKRTDALVDVPVLRTGGALADQPAPVPSVAIPQKRAA